MPCDTIQRSEVQFLAQSTDLDLLKKALEAMGYTVTETATGLSFSNYSVSGTYTKATGSLQTTVRGYGSTAGLDVNEVKRGYSEQVVNQQAKKFGWKVEWTTNKAGRKEAIVQKRS